jgi:hypothetical protein
MSKVEVNTIEPQCGTTLTVGKCTTNLRSGGNSLQAADGGNLISQSGTDITLGASGDTVALASGASQTGFGRTGTVDWDTTPKTGTVTAATGSGYFVDTTSGGITVNLPAGAAGSIVAVSDYASTAASNNITISPNGSEKINAVNDNFYINTAGLAVTLVYVDSTRGWKSVTGSDADATGTVPAFMAASISGACNTLTTVSTDYKLAKFLGPGTFTVSCAGNVAGSNSVDYIIVAGGGGGGVSNNGACKTGGGGGGAGGLRESSGVASGCYAVSPLGSGVAAVTVTATGYPISIGGAGPAAPGNTGSARNGTPTTALGLTATGGGGGSGDESACIAGVGGSGGGEGGGTASGGGGTGNEPVVSPPQGGMGSENTPTGAGGGGGSGGPYTPCTPYVDNAGQDGISNSITASAVSYAGGGGGGIPSGTPPGGDGGGGNGGSSCGTGVNGGTNLGGGGGGAGGGPGNTGASAGGSGIVYIRYKFQ